MPRGRDKGKGAKDLKRQAERELPSKKPKGSDEVLRATLKKAYLARAKLFVSALDERGPAKLLAALATVDASGLTWDKRADLGISEVAFEKVAAAGVEPHMVFSHPDVLRGKLLDYYRNLAALSKKGLDQTLRGITNRSDKVLAQVQFINGIISSIVEDMAVFDLLLAQAVIPAEIGTEIQGTWVNKIGQGAASRVRGLILKGQIHADAQVRKVFNLIEILEEERKRKEFLEELFVHQIRIVKSI